MEEKFSDCKSLLYHFLKGSKKYFFLSIIFACLYSLFNLFNPRFIGYIIDTVILSSDPNEYFHNHFYMVFVVVIGLGVTALIFKYLFYMYNVKGAEKLVETMRNQLYEKLMRTSFHWHSQNHTGDIIQRCTSDVETIKMFVSQQLTTLCSTVFLIVLILVFMSNISMKLAIISYIFIPINLACSILFYNHVGGAFEKADEQEGLLSSIAQENLTGIRVVKAFGNEVEEEKKFQKVNHEYTSFLTNLYRMLSMYWSTGDLFYLTQLLIGLILGCKLVLASQITTGDLVAYLSYSAMLQFPVRGVGRQIVEMSKANISLDRLRYIMNAEDEVNVENIQPCVFEHEICFDHVSFQYEDQPVLNDVSFVIEKGSSVGILGSTGSGKSTLLQLLTRMYKPTSGCIYIDGIDLQEMDFHEVRKLVGLIKQEPYLFSRSIKENITLGKPIDQKQYEQAIEIACLKDTIEGFEDGEDTLVGERGVSLSGGQVQRVAIAQMIVRNTPIMVFDDSLSALDASTDAKIQANLKQLQDITKLIISHRISSLQYCDHILVLDHGNLIQQGTHQELIAMDGMYQTIYRMQMEGRRCQDERE